MKYKFLYFLSAISITIISCSKVLEKANNNPNNPSDIPLAGLLPGAEVALAYNVAADYSIHSSVFIQQISGIGGFAVNDDKYNFSTANFNGPWNNAYTKTLINLSIIINKANASGAPAYSGIAKILSAISLGTLTDAYGDIPYKEALSSTQLAPHYQSQEDIYNTIQSLLDSAIIDLSQTGNIKPGVDDVIFKGDAAKWTAAAWTLKARYAIHLSKLDAKDAAQKALNYLYDGNNYRGIQNNDGDVAIVFGTANNQASPWFTQDAGRPGWYGMGAYFVNQLNGDPPESPIDPRRAAFAAPRPAPAPPDTYVGSLPGVPSAASNIVGVNTYYGVNTGPVSITNFPESKFIEAEARLILDPADAQIQVAFEDAVRASFAKVTSVKDTFATSQKQDEYINKVVQLYGTAEQKKEQIINQKYIALYLNPEAWTDYRRTGYPVLSPATGGSSSINPTGQIPRRFPYPNSEATLNPNIPTTSSDLQNPKLWWDQ
ncbi:MAG TPA: SusD/RagB family nutrient-binding outer membrane lipoprotein [Parafilimonas sp.]|nr:SusD/RagB family nutrient-binding outer membrane lipoprotein [Parafilimonas sp.]